MEEENIKMIKYMEDVKHTNTILDAKIFKLEQSGVGGPKGKSDEDLEIMLLELKEQLVSEKEYLKYKKEMETFNRLTNERIDIL